MSIRDNFTNKTKDILAKRVGYFCSNPECRKLTVGPCSENNKTINIGVAAHISAASKNGPRFNVNMSPAERKSIKNGIWLCQNCAAIIDRDIKQYSNSRIKNGK